MASPSQPATSTPPPADMPADDAAEEAEDETADLPLTMSASVILEHLPKDAHAALETAGEVLDARGEVKGKVKVRLSPLPNTSPIRPPVFNCGTAQRFEFVVRFLRRRLGLKDHESVFCYVNSVFAPGLDEGVGNLWRCFKVGDELVVSYSVTQAFG